jgi:hypothetical protein
MTKKEIKISEDELKIILGDDYPIFCDKILSSCFCVSCANETRIADYEIYLNEINDVILKGFCVACRNPVARYCETGESDECVAKIKKIKKKYS